jgi:hypothetical protein
MACSAVFVIPLALWYCWFVPEWVVGVCSCHAQLWGSILVNNVDIVH